MIEKIFKAYDVRATYPSPLNEEMAWKVGHATAQFLKRSRQGVNKDQQVKNENTIAVAADASSRPASSKELDGTACDCLHSCDLLSSLSQTSIARP